MEIDTETEITVTCGATEAMISALLAVVNPGDEVIIFAPFYENYGPDAIICDAVPRYVQLKAPEWNFDRAELEAAFTEKTRAVIINTPHNPTGKVFSRTELEMIAELCCRYDVLAISDEIYEHIIYDGFIQRSPAEISPEVKERTIILNGVSKSYSMTGWRIGFTAGPAPLIAAMTKIQSQSTSNPTSISQMAAIEAYNGPQDYVVNVLVDFSARRAYIIKALNEIPGISCFNPQGAFYAFPCVKDLFGKICQGREIDSSLTLCELLLDEAKIAAVPGEAFGAPGYLRLSYATSMRNIVKGIERLAEFVKALS